MLQQPLKNSLFSRAWVSPQHVPQCSVFGVKSSWRIDPSAFLNRVTFQIFYTTQGFTSHHNRNSSEFPNSTGCEQLSATKQVSFSNTAIVAEQYTRACVSVCVCLAVCGCVCVTPSLPLLIPGSDASHGQQDEGRVARLHGRFFLARLRQPSLLLPCAWALQSR